MIDRRSKRKKYVGRFAGIFLTIALMMLMAATVSSSIKLLSPAAAAYSALADVPGFCDSDKSGTLSEGDTIVLKYQYEDINKNKMYMTLTYAYDDTAITYLDNEGTGLDGYAVNIKTLPTLYTLGESDGNGKVFAGWRNYAWSESSNYFKDTIVNTNVAIGSGGVINTDVIDLYPVFLAQEETITTEEYGIMLLAPKDGTSGEDYDDYELVGINTFDGLQYKYNNVTKTATYLSGQAAILTTNYSKEGYTVKWNTMFDGSGKSFNAGDDLYQLIVDHDAAGHIGGWTIELFAILTPDGNTTTSSSENGGTTDSSSSSENGGSTTASNNGSTTSTTSARPSVTALSSAEISLFIEKIALFDSTFNKKTKNIAFYDISVPTGTTGKTKAFIPYPSAVAKNYKNYYFELYHWKSDGKVEMITSLTLDEDGVWFESDSFSPFALTWATKRRGSSTGSPNTGDDFNPLPIVIIAGVAAVGVVAVLVIKKKKDSAQ